MRPLSVVRVLSLSLIALLAACSDSPATSESSVSSKDTASPAVQSEATLLIQNNPDTGSPQIGVSGVFDLKGLVPGMPESSVSTQLPGMNCVPSSGILAELQKLPDASPTHLELYSKWSDRVCLTAETTSMTFGQEPAFYEVLLKNDKIQSVQITFQKEQFDKVLEGLALKFKLETPTDALGLNGAVAKLALTAGLYNGLFDEKGNQLSLAVNEHGTLLILSGPDLVAVASAFEKEQKVKKSGAADM